MTTTDPVFVFPTKEWQLRAWLELAKPDHRTCHMLPARIALYGRDVCRLLDKYPWRLQWLLEFGEPLPAHLAQAGGR